MKPDADVITSGGGRDVVRGGREVVVRDPELDLGGGREVVVRGRELVPEGGREVVVRGGELVLAGRLEVVRRDVVVRGL